MSIVMLKYGITKNLGDYNSERIDAEYQVAEGECAVTALASLKKFVTTGCLPESVRAVAPVKEEVKVEPKKEEVKKEVAPVKEEVKVEPKKEEVKVVKPKAEPKPKVEKPKEIPYSRDVKEHKAFLATILNDKFPTWKTDAEVKATALGVSEQLVGTPVLDNKGTLLNSFVDKVVELMSGPQL